MEIKRVKLSDIEPDPNNPREDFGDLKAFAKTFEVNPYASNEPFEPPKVVVDGDSYRLYDGERRWRAMCEAGKLEDCNVIVYEDYEEADRLTAMIATDDKKPLSEVERSQGVQRMLLLGVPAAKVQKVTGMRAAKAKKLKAAVDGFGGGVRQCTVDQIIAAMEVEAKGGHEESKAILDASEGEWQEVERKARERLAWEEARRTFEGYLSSAGMEVSEKCNGMHYERCYSKPDVLLEDIEGGNIPEGAAFKLDDGTRTLDMYLPGPNVAAYGAPDGPDGGVGDDGPSKVLDMTVSALAEGELSREEWYLKACKRGSSSRFKRIRATAHVDRVFEKAIERDSRLQGMCDRHGVRSDELACSGGLTGLVGVFMFSRGGMYPSINRYVARTILRGGKLSEADAAGAGAWCDWIEAFIADRWQPSENEFAFYKVACEELLRKPKEPEQPLAGEISPSSEAPGAVMSQKDTEHSHETSELSQIPEDPDTFSIYEMLEIEGSAKEEAQNVEGLATEGDSAMDAPFDFGGVHILGGIDEPEPEPASNVRDISEMELDPDGFVIA